MNIKGQWNRFDATEKRTLRRFAIAKVWKSYWGYKYKLLKSKEE